MEKQQAVYEFGRFARSILDGAPPQLLCTFDRQQREDADHPCVRSALICGCLGLPFAKTLPDWEKTEGAWVFDTPPFEKNAPAGLIRVTGVVDNLRWCVSGGWDGGRVCLREINGAELQNSEGWNLLYLLEPGSLVKEAEQAVRQSGGETALGNNRETLLFAASWPQRPTAKKIAEIERSLEGNILCERHWSGTKTAEQISD